jgi:hypothetical protein
VLGERAQERDLRAREPGGGAQGLGVGREQLLGRRLASVEVLEQPAVDRPRGLDGELLADDRAQERPVVRAAGPAVAAGRADLAEQAREDRVGGPQVLEGVGGDGVA